MTYFLHFLIFFYMFSYLEIILFSKVLGFASTTKTTFFKDLDNLEKIVLLAASMVAFWHASSLVTFYV